MKQIIAIGGGGFGRNPSDKKIEEYIIKQQNNKNPNVCFIPTATGDNDAYKVNFYDVFTKLNCNPTHIDFFKRTSYLEANKKSLIKVASDINNLAIVEGLTAHALSAKIRYTKSK